MRRLVGMDLAVLAIVSSWGSLVVYARVDGADKEAPRRPAPEILKAWRCIGANVGWMKMEPGDNRPTFQVEGQIRGLTVFQFTEWKEGVLAAMPDPGAPFGLGLNLTKMTDAGLKELASLKSLQELHLAGTQVTDVGLKELAGWKNLRTLDLRWTKVTSTGLKELSGLHNIQRLYLNHCNLTDDGVKELTALKSLQILNISASEVTDTGLSEVAALKNLQSLIMWGTKATPTGIAELRKKLPKCRIDDQ